MIFSIGKESLQAAISAPARIASKAVIDYMACVLIDAESGNVTFEATDQIESVRCSANALVEEPGRVLLPANMLSSIVKTLSDGAVTISATEGATRASIKCDKSSFDLPALNPSNFPAFPRVTKSNTVTIPSADFTKMVKAAATFASKTEKNGNREFMRAIFVQSNGSTVCMTSTDSYRVARISHAANGGSFEALFPASFLSGVVSSKHSSDITLATSDKQVYATCSDASYISRALEGSFPNVDRFFDGESNATALVDHDSISGAARRASAVCGVGLSDCPVKLAIADGTMTVSRSGGESGSMSEDVDTQCDGMCTISVNPVYLNDALAVTDSTIRISIENPMKPLVLTSGSFQAAIMPVMEK